jgi:D-alanyl-D-alanine endopeptidase (penicillin-binding protein 7)
MSNRAFRTLGALLLCAALAVPATMADAATRSRTRASSGTTVTTSRAKVAAKGSGKRTSRKRARRAALPKDGVYSRHAILVDPASGEVLFEKNSGRSVPIASLTKLMTTLVFIEQKPDLDHEAEITREDLAGAGGTQLRRGEQVRLGDLLHMSLMNSDNVATRVLARSTRLSTDDFVARMNQKAIELGLTGTRFVEFTGLDERNVSTASDVARLLHAAAHEPTIQGICTTRAHEFRTATRAHAIHNTNRLLYGDRYDVLGGKTGFISEAGYCFATWVRSQGRDLIAVVLGAPTGATRFADTVRLIQKSTAIAQPGL